MNVYLAQEIETKNLKPLQKSYIIYIENEEREKVISTEKLERSLH